MKQIKMVFSFAVIAAFTALFFGVTGCEKDGETGSDLDAYFAANPFISDPRNETGETDTGIIISPANATASAIGQKINFVLSGGNTPYTWGVSTPSAGSVAGQANSRFGVYTVNQLAKNSVIASDARGRSVIAAINSGAGGLAITPAGYTFESPYTYDQSTNLVLALTQTDLWGGIQGKTVQFTASGGNPPYSWTASSAAQGSINASGLYTVTTNVTIIGGNTVSVTDSAGDIESVTVTLKFK